MNPGIPKYVREALAGQAVTGQHPAADLLNAYAERALQAPEDTQIAGHLATCHACREVVFLANSAVEAPQLVTMPEARPAAKWWRWAVPVAALLAITATFLAMDKREGFFSKTQEARVANDSYAVAKPEAKSETPTTAPSSPQQRATRAKGQTDPQKKSMDVSEAKAKTVAGKSPESFTMDAAAKPGAPPPPAVLESQPVGSVAGGMNNTNAAAVQNSSSAMGGPSQRATQGVGANSTSGDIVMQKQVAPRAAASEAVEAQSSSDTLGAGRAKAFISPVQRSRRNAISRMAAELWRITPDGHLERLMQNQWHRALNQVQKAFRVVASVENHVWAGGKGPELFHSSDGGENWNSIQVKTADGTLNGTMRSIHADDSMHVAIITDNGETWITADGGQTWSKQQ